MSSDKGVFPALVISNTGTPHPSKKDIHRQFPSLKAQQPGHGQDGPECGPALSSVSSIKPTKPDWLWAIEKVFSQWGVLGFNAFSRTTYF